MSTAKPCILSIAWFGLGRFGTPIAKHLLASGYDIYLGAPQRSHGGTQALLSNGARELTVDTQVDCYVTCLPYPEDVNQVVSEMRVPPARYFVDFSTGSPRVAVELSQMLERREVRYIDAPLSGSIAEAEAGHLTCWVGSKDVSDPLLYALLSRVATNLYMMGGVGQGFAAKLVNQVIHIGNMAMLGEGLALGANLGLNLKTLTESLENASSDSAMLRRFGSSVVANDFSPRFRLELALKDMQLARNSSAAIETGSLAHKVAERLQHLQDIYGGDLDFSLLAGDHSRLESLRWGD